MITVIALSISVLLQIIAAISALWLLKASRVRIAWVMISVALFFMGFRRILEIYTILGGELSPQMKQVSYWLGITTSAIMAVSVIQIGRILYSFKRSDRYRQESENRFTTLFHNSSDEIYLADLKGNILEVNKVACDTLKYSREELLKMNFKDLKTPRYFNKVDENIARIVEKGTHVYDSEHVASDGKIISLEFKSRLIQYQEKDAILTIGRETTERKQMERRILSAVINAEEKERDRVSREIHDGLGPLLSTIKLYVNELEDEGNGPGEKKELLTHTNELINEAISSSRSISNNLTPRIILDFGLVKAVESFIKKINITQKVKIIFENRNINERLDQTFELILYRIITELINNTLKHAEAGKIEICLEILDGTLQVTYMDDGKGFDKELVMRDENSGMGMKNITSRLESINGSLMIHTRPGIGTLIVIEIGLENLSFQHE
jgi:PAS domain S-box-containing protein